MASQSRQDSANNIAQVRTIGSGGGSWRRTGIRIAGASVSEVVTCIRNSPRKESVLRHCGWIASSSCGNGGGVEFSTATRGDQKSGVFAVGIS